MNQIEKNLVAGGQGGGGSGDQGNRNMRQERKGREVGVQLAYTQAVTLAGQMDKAKGV